MRIADSRVGVRITEKFLKICAVNSYNNITFFKLFYSENCAFLFFIWCERICWSNVKNIFSQFATARTRIMIIPWFSRASNKRICGVQKINFFLLEPSLSVKLIFSCFRQNNEVNVWRFGSVFAIRYQEWTKYAWWQRTETWVRCLWE